MKLLFAIILTFLTATAQAQIEFGLVGGLRGNQAETDIRLATTSSRLGFQFGALGFFPIYPKWGVRSGVIYSQRFATLNGTADGDVDTNYSYFDVPATLFVHFSDIFAGFAGPILAFNQEKSANCTAPRNGCEPQDVKSLLVPWQVGINFRMLSQLGGEVFFEYVPGELSRNVLDMKTVGGQLIFYFE